MALRCVLCFMASVASATQVWDDQHPGQLVRREPRFGDTDASMAELDSSGEVRPVTDEKGSRAGLQEQISAIKSAIDKNAMQWPGNDSHGMLDAAVSSGGDNGTELRARLRRRYKDGSAFVFAALGSSVSAGHDNYPNQSWAYQLEEILKPAFKQAGFDFEARNRAMGGWGEMPFTSGCLKERVGADVDALNWEWDMFGDVHCEVQHFLWEVSDLDRRPVLFNFRDAAIRFDATKSPAEHVAVAHNRRKLLTHQGDDAAFDGGTRLWHPADWYMGEEFVSAADLEKWTKDGISSTLQDDAGNHFNPTPVGDAAKDFPSLPIYTFQTSASSSFVRGNAWYETREKAFNINWHPGPLGHHMVASQMSHYLLSQLVLALQEEENGQVMPPVPAGPSGKPCGMAKKKCYTGVEPLTSVAELSSLRSSDSKDNWTHDISLNQPMGGGPMQKNQQDPRRVYRGTDKDGELLLSIQSEGEKANYALICSAPCDWNCVAHTGYMSANTDKWWPTEKNGSRAKVSDAAFTVDGAVVPAETLVQLHEQLFGESGSFCPDPKCKLRDLCQPIARLEPGAHKVGMRVQPTTTQDPETFIELLQVMLVGEV